MSLNTMSKLSLNSPTDGDIIAQEISVLHGDSVETALHKSFSGQEIYFVFNFTDIGFNTLV